MNNKAGHRATEFKCKVCGAKGVRSFSYVTRIDSIEYNKKERKIEPITFRFFSCHFCSAISQFKQKRVSKDISERKYISKINACIKR